MSGRKGHRGERVQLTFQREDIVRLAMWVAKLTVERGRAVSESEAIAEVLRRTT